MCISFEEKGFKQNSALVVFLSKQINNGLKSTLKNVDLPDKPILYGHLFD